MFGSYLVTIAVVNYDRKHLENSKIGLENSWNFFRPRVGTLWRYFSQNWQICLL